MDEYILEAFDTVLKEFEMLEQTLNIKNSTVTKHRKRMEKQVKINSSMATKLNEIDNQLRECRKIMTKINSGEESEAITHTTCNCQTQQMHLVGDGKAKISDCTCCIKRFDQKVTSWLRNVKTRSFDLQKERSQLQKALEYAEIGLPIDTRTVMDFPLQPATHHAVLRSHFIKFPEIKRKHTRLCETELELQKYKSITEKCKQISQQCKVFSESYTKTSKQQFRSIPSTGAGGILQSTSYRQAIMKAQVPFMHHYILECNHNGLEYTFEDHDITLIIPEGAVAKDQTIHIEFDATMCGPFIFPENTRPISPIVWLCLLEKDAKLKKPFQLILQHFLTGLIKEEFQQYQIGFMKANHHKSTVEGGDMTYVFSPSNSKPLFASRGNKSYAVLESDHCCFYCLEAHITPDLARDAGYCLTQIERPLSRRRHEVYFVATYCLDTCIQALRQQFQTEEGYKIVHHDEFKFRAQKTPRIKLMQDEQPNNDQCIIAWEPSIAQIEASKIEFWSIPHKQLKLKHDMKMYPPYVKMTFTMTNTTPLKFSVQVTGCLKEANLKRDITFPLGNHTTKVRLFTWMHEVILQTTEVAHYSIPNGISQLQNRSHTVITAGGRPKLRDALRMLLPIAAHWRNIGVLLGIENNLLGTIKRNEEQVEDCLREMLLEWLKNVHLQRTWCSLANAVEPFDQQKAQEIRDSVA